MIEILQQKRNSNAEKIQKNANCCRNFDMQLNKMKEMTQDHQSGQMKKIQEEAATLEDTQENSKVKTVEVERLVKDGEMMGDQTQNCNDQNDHFRKKQIEMNQQYQELKNRKEELESEMRKQRILKQQIENETELENKVTNE